MKIDKSKLKIGIWYEDAEGNILSTGDTSVDPTCAPEGAVTYHSCFPLEMTERVYTVHTAEDKKKCKHRRKYWKKTVDLIKGYKGHSCTKCGCCQVRKWYQPWDDLGTQVQA